MLSWFKPKSQLPEPTALQVLRAKQIEQLKSINCTVAEIQRDVEYRVNVNDWLSLHIALPPQFPQEKPVLKVSPNVSHQWVNDQMIITGCAALNTFKAHSDLGKVVKEVVEEFRKNPPVATAAPSYSTAISTLPVVAAKPVTTMSSSYWQPYPVQQGPSSSSATIPGVADSFPALEDMSAAELIQLKDNEEKMLKLLEPYVQVLEYNRAECVQALETAALENIAKQKQMEEKKRIILEKYETLNNMRHRLDELLKLQDERRKKYELQLIQDNLKVASLEADEKAEAFADDFLEQRLTVDDFLKNYMSARIQCHQRRALEDKLSQHISHQSSNYN